MRRARNNNVDACYICYLEPYQMWTLDRACGRDTTIFMTFKDRFYDCRGFFTELLAVGGGQRYAVEEIVGFDSLNVDELCMFKVTTAPGWDR